jgi:MFS family permease
MARSLVVRLPDFSQPLVRIQASTAVQSLGQGLTLPYLLIFLHTQRNIPAGLVGVAVGLAALGSFAFSGPIGYMVDKFGPGRVLVFGTFFAGLASLSWAFVSTRAEVFLAAFGFALANALMWGPRQAFVGRLAGAEGRQRQFGIGFLLINLGIGLGGVLGSIIIRHQTLHAFQLLYFINCALYFIAGFIAITVMRDGGPVHEEHHKEHGGYRQVVRDRKLWFMVGLGTLLVIAGYGSLEIFVPGYITQVADLPARVVGWGFAANTITIVFAQMYVLKMLQGRSRAYTLAGVAFIWSLSWIILGASALVATIPAIILAVGSQAVFGFAETGYMPVLNTIVNDMAPEALRGRYNAVAGIAWGVGNTLGPSIGGIAIGGGFGGYWLVTLAVLCVVAGFVAMRLRGVLTPEQDGRVPAPAVAQGS